MTQTHKDPRAVIEQLVGALETCIVVTTGPGESEQLYNFNSVEAAITAGREALEQVQVAATHYLDEMGICYTAARAKFIGMDTKSMTALYTHPQASEPAKSDLPPHLQSAEAWLRHQMKDAFPGWENISPESREQIEAQHMQALLNLQLRKAYPEGSIEITFEGKK